MSHVILDGMLIESDRLAGTRDNGNDLWFSQKHKGFGGNVQFLSAPDGTPLWVSDVEPGSTPDITATRLHVLPALYKAAAYGLPTLADKEYIGIGIGIRVPVRRPKGKSEQALDTDTRTTNFLFRDLRALGERTAAELKTSVTTPLDGTPSVGLLARSARSELGEADLLQHLIELGAGTPPPAGARLRDTPRDPGCTKVPTISLISYRRSLNIVGISAGHEHWLVPTSGPGHTSVTTDVSCHIPRMVGAMINRALRCIPGLAGQVSMTSATLICK
jgi:hypothetical protein